LSGPASSSPVAGREPLPAVGFLLLAALTLFWGLNWPAMKLALAEIPIWSFRTVCVTVGGLGLLLLARIGHGSVRVPSREIGPLLFCGLFNVVAWHICTGYGVSLIEAGRASIIAFTMPVWAALLSVVWLDERLTWRILLGLACGLAALAFLIGPDLTAVSSSPLGALCMLGAALSWAIATVAVKRHRWSIPSAVLMAWQLVMGIPVLAVGALLLGERPDPGALSVTAWLALLYIVTLPMIFCQWGFLVVVRLFPATVAAVGTLAIPVVGVFSSALLLAEPLGATELAALALVCTALGLVLLRRRL
jgi:drug/metabolite transporter (DMT)-like permease